MLSISTLYFKNHRNIGMFNHIDGIAQKCYQNIWMRSPVSLFFYSYIFF